MEAEEHTECLLDSAGPQQYWHGSKALGCFLLFWRPSVLDKDVVYKLVTSIKREANAVASREPVVQVSSVRQIGEQLERSFEGLVNQSSYRRRCQLWIVDSVDGPAVEGAVSRALMYIGTCFDAYKATRCRASSTSSMWT